jgi:hypothetical protein
MSTWDFVNVAKQILFVTENISSLNEKVSTLAKDVAAIDRRLIRMETMAEMSQQAPRRRSLRGDQS